MYLILHDWTVSPEQYSTEWVTLITPIFPAIQGIPRRNFKPTNRTTEIDWNAIAQKSQMYNDSISFRYPWHRIDIDPVYIISVWYQGNVWRVFNMFSDQYFWPCWITLTMLNFSCNFSWNLVLSKYSSCYLVVCYYKRVIYFMLPLLLCCLDAR